MPARSRLGAAVLLCSAAAGLTACGSAVSTSGFKGEQHAVAQGLADLQSDATAGEQKKVCAKDLAASVVSALGGASGCESAVKERLTDIDNLELSVESVQLGSDGKSATARVKSTFHGKKHLNTVSLVKEGGKWKLAKLGV